MNDVGFVSGALPSVFAGAKPDDKLAGGIAASYGVFGYRGKVWSVKYRGEETKLMRLDLNGNEDGPSNSIEVVILDANDHLSKNWFEGGWVEGSNAPPDCYSNNGVTPEPSSPKLQSPTCATCKRNVWGATVSKVTGKPAKECQDNKRLAVVPLGNIMNERFGGPMLLRVPAASLQELVNYSQKMKQLGFPYYSVGTKISFDVNANYPKFLFSGIRVLTPEEAVQVIAHREGPQIARVLAEAAQEVTPAGNVEDARQAALNEAFEQPPQTNGPQTNGQTEAWVTQRVEANKVQPSTGAASSTNAQPAAQSSQTPPQQSSAPASVSPSTSQTLREQLVASLAGGAGTAATGNTQTNGASSSSTTSTPNPAPQSAPAQSQSDAGRTIQTGNHGTDRTGDGASESSQPSTAPSESNFEATLDQMLEGLI